MNRLLFILSFIFFFFSFSAFSQEKEIFRVMFWNVENLFDTERDSLKQDDEFLPTSVRGWNVSRYKKKMADVSRVITAVGEWEPPALVGLCEVENDRVMQYLTRYSPLKEHNYRYVMTESEDVRGIDVALLYQRDKFKLLEHQYLRPDLGIGERPTRDILHVVGLVPSLDTLDVFVAHFPSRSGGERESEWKRLRVAALLKNAVDSLARVRDEARILVMGDFNDEPRNKSVAEVLCGNNTLYHLLIHTTDKKKKYPKENRNEPAYGSYKYQGEWGLLDHLMVSDKLLDDRSRFYTNETMAEVVTFPFLLVEDEKFGGQQPFRTYYGMKYQGGYSDHLPVRVDFQVIP